MRINVIPVQALTNVHLRAEYREIVMSFHYYFRSSRKKGGIDFSKIPKEYTLNTGHATFFFDKFLFIKNRFLDLKQEMIKRNYSTTSIDKKFNELYDKIPNHLKNDYIYTQKDLDINIERIVSKIFANPKMYKEKTPQEWKIFYENL